MKCTCWVQRQPIERRYRMPWAAHSLTCPWNRPSPEPVDQIHDEQIRLWGEKEYGDNDEAR